MTSRLKLKRKKFQEPYKEDSNKNGFDGNLRIESECKEVKILKNQRIFERAIENAKKHKIRLNPGTENDGQGNCSYESVILNIKDRDCFKDKLPMSPSFYRRIWNTDLMNKILDKRIPWNPGMTSAEIQEGFQELMDSGIYERSFFGDMMMAGIACGARKRILIFNTHEMTTHDPISVIDPTHYGGSHDTEIPVVLAYDLVHYESLEPEDAQDIQETVKLSNAYTSQPSRYMLEYGFTRKDMLYLVTPQKNTVKKDDVINESQRESGDVRVSWVSNMKETSNKNQNISMTRKTYQETQMEKLQSEDCGTKHKNGDEMLKGFKFSVCTSQNYRII